MTYTSSVYERIVHRPARKKQNPAEAGFCRRREARSDHRLRQLTLGIPLGHLHQRLRLDLASLAFAAKLQVALLADLLGGFACGFEVIARVELVGVCAMYLRIAPVMAKRTSVSMLILRTPNLMAS